MTGRFRILSTISLGHFVVDTACIMLVINLSEKPEPMGTAFLVLLYDLLAFATQPVFGYIIDKLKKPEKAAALGCLVTAAGVAFYPVPYLAICVSGIGNAIFHVGGGVVSLKLDPGKAWAPGVFIAPGTLGVFIGTLLGKRMFIPWLLTAALIALVWLHNKIRTPAFPSSTYSPAALSNNRLFNLALSLILITVVIRSFAGLGISYVWKTDILLSLVFSCCVMLGKAFGGILSDRFGFLFIPLTGLILSVPCLVLGFSNPVAGSAGILLFNLTMPVTLLLTANLFPGNEGLGFGMTVLALSIGTIPAFAGVKLAAGLTLAIVVLASAITFFFGFRLYEKLTHRI